jgi:hypothetical protein
MGYLKLVMISENPLENTMWHKYLTEQGKQHDIEYTGIYSPDLMDDEKFEPNHMIDADFVFIYAANYGHKAGIKPIWKWYELPYYAKRFIDSKTKCGAIFDVEDHIESGRGYPKEWWNSVNAMDMMFTGVRVPDWSRFTDTPIVYIVEPKPMVEHIPKLKLSGNIAVLRHTPIEASAFHTIENTILKTGKHYTYFHSGWSSAPKLPVLYPSEWDDIVWNLKWEEYLKEVAKCFIAIDDNEGYYGWSRFGYECAMMGVPVISSDHAYSAYQFFPELRVEHKDYTTQRMLIHALYDDPDTVYRLAIKGMENMRQHLDPDVCIERLKAAAEIVL